MTIKSKSIKAAFGLAGLGLLYLYGSNVYTIQQDKTVHNDWGDSCAVNMNVKQGGRVSLDITKHGKDIFNETQFALPTACNETNNYKKGQEVLDEFRWGSFVLELGSMSSWKMHSTGKQEPANADQSSCSVELTLRERRFTFNPILMGKDPWNAQSFNWNIPCDVYDQVEVGHNFVTDPLREGSLIKRAMTNNSGKAVSMWSVEVSEKYPKPAGV
ncbi:MAG: hypothetical protein VX740_05835 [Pseudomonadota bacterium]|jgi:hypothetical protein|nr:hypothetical protein [Alphaproteobacteria bacterium]MCS5596363.1 hypothetical protein [Alphaproteobacteria bacterium]MEC7575712.1 hypothetical protein [Pseudomonadota bacterium]MEC7702853.1 hypothetical protein [Pseudomonadota bacterium]MED5422941.1 hypothetical protein [Pseudomonadota bacterium]|tara:strand:+ start:404 stop:1048 length:645 start_codon:yes stop_codon:yes gene_type:complete